MNKTIFLITILLIALGSSCYTKTLFCDFSTGDSKGISSEQQGDGNWKNEIIDNTKCALTQSNEGVPFVYLKATEDMPKAYAFVTIEYFDALGNISVEYDSEGYTYKPSTNNYEQKDTKKWIKKTFLLFDPIFSKKQNGGNDLRIGSNISIAIKRIEITNEQPEGFIMPMDPNKELDKREPAKIDPKMTAIQQWQVHEPIIKGQLSDTAYERANKIGITSMQSYVGWKQIEPEKGKTDFSYYDPLVDQLRKHNMKWLPFLIMAPEITVPEWWNNESGVFVKCLEHGKEAPVQSIWNPNLRAGVKRFLELFKAHYEPEVIEALNFGISGCWGESIQVAGGGFGIMDRHQHAGFWCGDVYAQKSFRDWLQKKYTQVSQLNKAWNTSYDNFNEITCFIPDSKIQNNRAIMDLSRWYMESMTDLAEFWVKTARELYPNTKIYLCTGGFGETMLGADFGEQVKRIAPYGAGIRITNQGDDVFENFSFTRMVSSATRLYGQYYTTEPGGDNTPNGIPGRIFDATAGGAIGAYFKYLMDSPDSANIRGIRFMDNSKYFMYNEPKLSVATIMPNTDIALYQSDISKYLKQTTKLRKALDYEWIDENMIGDNLLNNFKAVAMLTGTTLEQKTIDKLEAWVKNGGVLFMSNENLPLVNVENVSTKWIKANKQKNSPAIIYDKIEKKPGYIINIGTGIEYGIDESWHAPEGISNTSDVKFSYRWTTGNSKINIPIPSGKKLILKVFANSSEIFGLTGDVLINGTKVITIVPEKKSKWYEATIPTNTIPTTGEVTITFKSKTFCPSESDPRNLGLNVGAIILKDSNIKDEEATLLTNENKSLNANIDPSKLFIGTVNPLGKGYVVVFPESGDVYLKLLAKALYANNAPWGGPLTAVIDGDFDNVASAIVKDQVLYINNGSDPVLKTLPSGKQVNIEPYTIISLPLSEVTSSK